MGTKFSNFLKYLIIGASTIFPTGETFGPGISNGNSNLKKDLSNKTFYFNEKYMDKDTNTNKNLEIAVEDSSLSSSLIKNYEPLKYFIPVSEGKISCLYGWRKMTEIKIIRPEDRESYIGQKIIKEKIIKRKGMDMIKLWIEKPDFHGGLDIGPKIGGRKNPYVLSSAKGLVIFSGYNLRGRNEKRAKKEGYGLYVKIMHIDSSNINNLDTSYTIYAHLNTSFVKEGDLVYAQQVIGVMGNTGKVVSNHGGDGTHLHWELIINKKKINPKHYLADYHNLKRDDEVYASLNYLPTINITPKTVEEPPLFSEGFDIINKINPKVTISKKDNINNNFSNEPYALINYTDTTYGIQVAASAHKLPLTEIRALQNKYGLPIKEDKIDTRFNFKYTIGEFNTKEQAKSYRDSLGIKGGIAIFENKKLVKVEWR